MYSVLVYLEKLTFKGGISRIKYTITGVIVKV
jgi:hypothetical protein